jgi:hypothetical protein
MALSRQTYQTDFCCTYYLLKDEKEEGIELLYQLQLLQAFNLDLFDDKIINDMTEELYEKYKDNHYIKTIIETDILKINHIFLDKITQFRSYFGYETFHLFHDVLCCLIDNKKMNETKYQKLITSTTSKEK